MTKRDQTKLINAMVRVADEYLGGERSKTAGPVFADIARECREMGLTELAHIMQQVAFHYLYD